MKVLSESGLAVLIRKILDSFEYEPGGGFGENACVDGQAALVPGVSGAYSLRKSAAGRGCAFAPVCFCGDFSTEFSVSADAKIAELPPGFRPPSHLTFPAAAVWQDNSAGVAKVEIFPGGDVIFTGYENWASVKNVKVRNLYVSCTFNL
jgi:hypothetical protein